MIIKVKYFNLKKYVKISEPCLEMFITEVRVKFSIPEDKTLTVTDDGGTEVDADVFPELVTKDVCLVIHDSEGESPASESSGSLTDTLSLLSSQGSEVELSQSKRACLGAEMLQCVTAKDLVKNVLLEKPGGATVLKEYEDTGKICDSSRRQMVHLAHWTGDSQDMVPNPDSGPLTRQRSSNAPQTPLKRDPEKCQTLKLSLLPRAGPKASAGGGFLKGLSHFLLQPPPMAPTHDPQPRPPPMAPTHDRGPGGGARGVGPGGGAGGWGWGRGVGPGGGAGGWGRGVPGVSQRPSLTHESWEERDGDSASGGAEALGPPGGRMDHHRTVAGSDLLGQIPVGVEREMPGGAPSNAER
ncbi:unnamed protein product [Arctogadus glacialis]